MRITRLLLVLTALIILAQPVFACRECTFLGECEFGVPPPTDGCRFTPDGCTDGLPCNGFSATAAVPALSAQWRIVSVEVKQTSPKTTIQAVNAQPALAAIKLSTTSIR